VGRTWTNVCGGQQLPPVAAIPKCASHRAASRPSVGLQPRMHEKPIPTNIGDRDRPKRNDRRIRRNKMKNFASKLRHFIKSEDGPTAVEYAVMLALIVIVCLTAITNLGTNAKTTFTNIGSSIGS
jgi:pilus assembly protein Flp/PilA